MLSQPAAHPHSTHSQKYYKTLKRTKSEGNLSDDPKLKEISTILKTNKIKMTTASSFQENDQAVFILGDASDVFENVYKGMPLHVVATQIAAANYYVRNTFTGIQKTINFFDSLYTNTGQPKLDSLCGYVAEEAESKAETSGGGWIQEGGNPIWIKDEHEKGVISSIAIKIGPDANIAIIQGILKKIKEKVSSNKTTPEFTSYERFLFFYFHLHGKKEKTKRNDRYIQLINAVCFKQDHKADGSYHINKIPKDLSNASFEIAWATASKMNTSLAITNTPSHILTYSTIYTIPIMAGDSLHGMFSSTYNNKKRFQIKQMNYINTIQPVRKETIRYEDINGQNPTRFLSTDERQLLVHATFIRIISDIMTSENPKELYYTFMRLIHSNYKVVPEYTDVKKDYDEYFKLDIVKDNHSIIRMDLCYNMIAPIKIDENITYALIPEIIRNDKSENLRNVIKNMYLSIFKIPEQASPLSFSRGDTKVDKTEETFNINSIRIIKYDYPDTVSFRKTESTCNIVVDKQSGDSVAAYLGISSMIEQNHRLMAILSQLAYCKTNRIKTFFTERNPIKYLKSYDEDPLWKDKNCNIIKHKIHAFYRIMNNNTMNIYIAFRGSHTSDDWNDIDTKITQGRAVFFDKRVHEISNAINMIQNEIANKVVGTYKVQIYSCGHSLGGFLALMAAYRSLTSLVRARIQKKHGEKTSVHTYNTKIIPIVFNPFCGFENNIMLALSCIPLGYIYRVYSKHKDAAEFHSDIASLGIIKYKDSMQFNFYNVKNICESFENYYFIEKYRNFEGKEKITEYLIERGYTPKGLKGLIGPAHTLYNFLGMYWYSISTSEMNTMWNLHSYKDIEGNDKKKELQSLLSTITLTTPAPVRRRASLGGKRKTRKNRR
jgi:hypothetical protein